MNHAEREEALRRSRIEAKVWEEQAAIQRARLEEQNKVEIEAKEEAVRKAKATGDINLAEVDSRAAQRRSQLELELTTERKLVE